MEPLLGSIILFAGTFAPRGWAFCEGQLLAISQNQALFSILGTTYGGDGRTTFALPDLRGRSPVHQGTGPGLGAHPLGEKYGHESVTLNVTQLPSHSHGTTYELPNAMVSMNPMPTVPIAYDRDPMIATATLQSMPTGGGQPVGTASPSLALNYIIATQGVFPSRP